jgi:AraC-like DNA-binding protein
VYYLPENSDYWEFVFITMVGRESFRVIQSVESRKGNIIPAEEIPKTMGLLHDLIFKLFSQTITNPYDNSTHSYALCMALLDETTASEKTGELFTFEELLVFLNENIHRDITIDEMAGLMRRSRSHFTRLFTGNTGISPRQYLEDLRLRSAISLLMNENINIKETAAMVGIRDENYFCRLFKKRYGLSPGKFKNRKYWQ